MRGVPLKGFTAFLLGMISNTIQKTWVIFPRGESNASTTYRSAQ
jgi:hypothetical protein